MLKIFYFCSKQVQMKAKVLFLVVILAIIAAGCKKDNEDAIPVFYPAGESPTVFLKMDGVPYNAICFTNTLLYISDSLMNSRRLDIIISFKGGQKLTLSVQNFDFQNPPADGILAKKYDVDLLGSNSDQISINGITYTDVATGTYVPYTPLMYVTSTTDTSGYITINICKTDIKTVSGSFGFKVSNPDNTVPISFIGTFENQKYTIINK